MRLRLWQTALQPRPRCSRQRAALQLRQQQSSPQLRSPCRRQVLELSQRQRISGQRQAAGTGAGADELCLQKQVTTHKLVLPVCLHQL